MFEHYKQPLISRRKFTLRMLRSGGISLLVIGMAIFVGMWGFHYLENMAWLDSLLNSVMVMTGISAVPVTFTGVGKVFTAAYAIFSNLAFFAVIVILVAPILHRLMHYLNLDIESKK